MDKTLQTVALKKRVRPSWRFVQKSPDTLLIRKTRISTNVLLALAGVAYLLGIFILFRGKAFFFMRGFSKFGVGLIVSFCGVFGILFTIFAHSMNRVKTVLNKRKRMIIFNELMFPKEKPTVFAAFRNVRLSQKEFGAPPDCRLWEMILVRKDGKDMRMDGHSDFIRAVTDAERVAAFLGVPLIDDWNRPLSAEAIFNPAAGQTEAQGEALAGSDVVDGGKPEESKEEMPAEGASKESDGSAQGVPTEPAIAPTAQATDQPEKPVETEGGKK